MPRYEDYDYRQSKLLPVSFERQILPGTFEQIGDSHHDNRPKINNLVGDCHQNCGENP